MSDDPKPHRHRRTRRHHRGPSRSSLALFALLAGVLLGIGPGMFLAFGLPASYFRAEWTQVRSAPPFPPQTNQVSRIAMPGDVPPLAPAAPTSRYAERTWQVIGTLENASTAPTPAP